MPGTRPALIRSGFTAPAGRFAPPGSLWSRFRTEVFELRERPGFPNRADARARSADYFDCSNQKRLDISNDYQTAYHAHQQLIQLNTENCSA